MQRTQQTKSALKVFFTLSIAALFIAAPAYADKPEWAGNKENKHEGKHEKKEKNKDKDKDKEVNRDERAYERNGLPASGRYFTEQHRVIVHDYYLDEYKSKRCPPGLAKKHNGCMPPGQAKKWVVGRPIPREVVYYNVPQPVIVRLGPPPSGQRYIRVASDILLIAIGTGMVLDAVQDLQR